LSLSCGIVGAPNAGKSTLFKVLTSIPVEIASYPFSTVKPNTGLVPLEDERLVALAEVMGSNKTTFASFKVVDVAGLIKGASKGEGLGNQFLAQIREMEVLLHVIGEFSLNSEESELTSQVIDLAREVNLELMLADLEAVEKRISKIEKVARLGDKESKAEIDLLERIKQHLNGENPARTFIRNSAEDKILKEINLLTDKKVLYVLNRDEENINQGVPYQIKEFVERQNASLVTVSCRLELEIRELDDNEREVFKKEFDLYRDPVKEITDTCYHLLGLITFFTVKGQEARAWLVSKGTTAWEAAGKIHSDMQKGFRSVEVINWNDMVRANTLARAREEGTARIEGKDYAVQEGDVLFVKFSS